MNSLSDATFNKVENAIKQYVIERQTAGNSDLEIIKSIVLGCKKEYIEIIEIVAEIIRKNFPHLVDDLEKLLLLV